MAAEVDSAVDRMLARSVAWSICQRFAFYGAFAGLVASFLAFQDQLSLAGLSFLGVAPDCGVPIGIALMASLRRSFQGIALRRALACLGLAVVAVLAAPHFLRVYDEDLRLYPNHFLFVLDMMSRQQVDAGQLSVAHYLRDWSDAALTQLRQFQRIPIPHSYVTVPMSDLARWASSPARLE